VIADYALRATTLSEPRIDSLNIEDTTSAISPHGYEVRVTESILTPALLIYRDFVLSNIDTTIRLLNGNPDRWRPHVKTAKLGYVMEMLTACGVTAFKCATSLELLTAIRAGARDVLVAYPVMGANAIRIREIAAQNPQVAISVLVESARQLDIWVGTGVGIFVDINPGMDRTGIEQGRAADIVELAKLVCSSGLEFRGLHYYDGHLGSVALPERERQAHAGYDRLMHVVETLRAENIPVKEVITAGTPAFPFTLSYPGFQNSAFVHRASPGTVVYCDATAAEQLPDEFGYIPAALILSRVVSRPANGIVTCDAGHKTLSVDCGVPNCLVAGMSYLEPLRPSEEHLPFRMAEKARVPELGDLLYLIPRHVCPTVNNFDWALIIAQGNIVAVEQVHARGREKPLLHISD
jgi:D-serine deaminase-like pyridoxal phosphate-dependent protein